MTYESALQALADPTRRAVFERLAQRPQAVSELAEGLPVSRPAVSQHLKVLKEAGLVTDERQGRRTLYRMEPRGLVPLRDWLDGLWSEALTSFKQALEGPSGPGVELVEHSVDGERCSWGRVLAWEPPHRLVFSFGAWRGAEQATEVEVIFTPDDAGGTHVELIHRGWERLGDDARTIRPSYVTGWDAVFVERFGGFVEREG